MHIQRLTRTQRYNVSMILDDNLNFNQAKYEAYSPLYLSTTFALCYGISFATVTSVVVHTYLYHGTEIVQRYKMARNQEDDVHMRLMKKYRDAPDWWYLAMFLVMVSNFLLISSRMVGNIPLTRLSCHSLQFLFGKPTSYGGLCLSASSSRCSGWFPSAWSRQ